ncbi:MAG TPA: hypothetical protein VM012_00185 [Flavitalea sp.]|nr:hypothetical protein [Flavitalea sp.]
MNNDPHLSESESLEIIRKMINKAKGQFSENGHMYLLWGWVILICSLAQYYMIHFTRYEKHYLVWMLTWIAFIYQLFYVYRLRKKRRVRTYTDDILAFVWITFVILMFLFGFIFSTAPIERYYRLINPGFLALYGMPTFLSGIILKFRPLVIGGICCWLLAVAASYIHYDYQLLLLAAAVVVAWIIPGYILRARYKKANS